MDILFHKEQKLCATCLYWGGSKEMRGDAINVDFISYGKCEHPNNSQIDKQIIASSNCSKYMLYPVLQYAG